jgi:hypothetical protein
MLILLIAIEVKIVPEDCIVIKFVVSVVLFWVEVPSPFLEYQNLTLTSTIVRDDEILIVCPPRMVTQ